MQTPSHVSLRPFIRAASLTALSVMAFAAGAGLSPRPPVARGDTQVGPAPVLRASTNGRSVSVTARFPGCQPEPGGDPRSNVCSDSPGAAAESTRVAVASGQAVELKFDQPVTEVSGHLRTLSLKRTTSQFTAYQGPSPDRWVVVIPRRGLGSKRELVLNGRLGDGRGPQWLVRLHRRANCR